MQIKIGVQHVGREITFDSDQSPEDVTELVEQAIAAGSVLKLVDKRNNIVVVPAAALGYVELGKIETHSVGFGVT